MNEFESRLRDQLRVQAADVTTAQSMADGARRRAGRIRRRRIAGGGVLVAAATGVAIPVAMSLGGSPLAVPEPAVTPSPAPEDPTPSPAPDVSPDPDRSPEPDPSPDTPNETPQERGGTATLTLDGLFAGAPPEIGWVESGTLHTADGRETDIPDGVFDPMAFGDGLVGSAVPDAGGPDTAFVDADGDVTVRRGFEPVMSADRELVAWYDEDASQLRFEAAGGGLAPDPIDVPSGQPLEPAGFVGPDALIVDVHEAPSRPVPVGVRRYSLSDGSATDLPDVLNEAMAVSQSGLVAGLTEEVDGEICSVVLAPDSDEPLWRTCEYKFDRFSPDGRYLLGTHIRADGMGDPYAIVVDARTGEPVHRFDAQQPGYIGDGAFEEDGNVLLEYTTSEDGETAIVRCSLDGACEAATEVRPAEFGSVVYGLSPQP